MLNLAFMSFSCPELDFDGFLQLARWYGYQGVEPRIEAGHAHGVEMDLAPDLRRAYRAKAEEKCVALCCVATSRRYADPAQAQSQIDDTLRCIDLAADLGAPCIRVFGGALPQGLGRETAIEGVAACLSAVADHAAARGVTVCMETHDDWCNPNHVAAVMRRVDHPAIAVNWDVMHPVRTAGWDIEDAFRTLAPWIRHMHVHDGLAAAGSSELRPMGEGEIDHKRALALALESGYGGYLSGEWINWQPWEIHLPRELSVLRRYEWELRGGESA
jgi:sugar phosphate isomerase/epimerase